MNTTDSTAHALSSDSIALSFIRHDNHLHVIASGFKSPAGIEAALAKLRDVLAREKVVKVLIDVTRVAGQMSATDHAGVGEAFARHVPGVRCAVVARADRPEGEVEPFARAGGVDYKAFDDEESALRWLGTRAA